MTLLYSYLCIAIVGQTLGWGLLNKLCEGIIYLCLIGGIGIQVHVYIGALSFNLGGFL